MNISNNGLQLIKSFEGCRLTAYKAVSTEKYYTIGYGHYGADVKEGMKITQAQADNYLLSDVSKSVQAVQKIVNAKYTDMNQNQFDALVSFTYNCGAGNLTKLTNSNKRTYSEISEKLLSYNKSGGKVLAGLTKRRTAEKKLFDTSMGNKPVVARPTLRQGSKGIQVKYLQQDLNYLYNAKLLVDGIFGSATARVLKQFQKDNKISSDGIYGNTSYKKMFEKVNAK